MSPPRQLLSYTYPLLRVKKALNKAARKRSGADLRVLLYHDISPSQIGTFATQLQWLSQRWRFVTPAEFAAFVRDESQPEHDSLLLTFDDGFASNRLVAECILQPAGIKAVFFVVTDFIEQTDREAARAFICERLQAGSNPETLPAHWTNMTWNDLAALLEMGHTIGAHTASHERLTADVVPAVMQREIVAGADRLEARLGTSVRHFAFPFGDFASFSAEAMAVAAQRFDFVYSGLRGNNAPVAQPLAIRRESQTPNDSFGLLGAFIEGASDFRYRRCNAILDRWAQQLGRGRAGGAGLSESR